MKTKLVLSLLFGSVLLIACKSSSHQHLKELDWLLGTWENLPAEQRGNTQRGSIYETWTKLNPNKIEGKSYSLKGNDTIVFEKIQLVQENGQLFYIPTVKNQNDALPVKFTMKTMTETSVSFENPTHDFPQVISYTKRNADSLIAEILGTKKGQERKVSFPMRKIK